jgi:DNA-directed RNA polymerase sigma subunit (sigma70/sigma32)
VSEYACSGVDVFSNSHKPVAAGVGHSSSAGTFALRRANYINKTSYINEIRQSDEPGQELLMSAEQQQAIMEMIGDDDFVAKQMMIAQHLRLVVDVAERHINHGIALFDLVREGHLGLMHALESFELKDGVRFSIYATRCIRQSIERAVMQHE